MCIYLGKDVRRIRTCGKLSVRIRNIGGRSATTPPRMPSRHTMRAVFAGNCRCIGHWRVGHHGDVKDIRQREAGFDTDESRRAKFVADLKCKRHRLSHRMSEKWMAAFCRPRIVAGATQCRRQVRNRQGQTALAVNRNTSFSRFAGQLYSEESKQRQLEVWTVLRSRTGRARFHGRLKRRPDRLAATQKRYADGSRDLAIRLSPASYVWAPVMLSRRLTIQVELDSPLEPVFNGW